MQDAFGKYVKTGLHAAILSAALLTQVPSALAIETIENREGSGRRREWADPQEPEAAPRRAPVKAIAMTLMVKGKHYHPKNIPTIGQAHREVCSDSLARSARSLCRRWPEAKKSFEAAGFALGLPASGLVCLMKAETNLIGGQVSPVGARGLTQFMPRTAEHYANVMSNNEYFQEAWDEYREYGGTTRRRGAFTSHNIRSSSLDMADVQIFASAMYFRRVLMGKGFQRHWTRHMGTTENPDSNVVRKLFHSLLVAYNAGPKRAEKFVYTGSTNYRMLPGETREYIRKFDKCMASAMKK